MFIAALLQLPKIQKQPKCPSIGELIKICVCILYSIHTHTHTHTKSGHPVQKAYSQHTDLHHNLLTEQSSAGLYGRRKKMPE